MSTPALRRASLLHALVFAATTVATRGETAEGDRLAPPATTPLPAAEVMHDHTPRHGGTVGMSGSRHLEAVAQADGTLALYLTDLFRTPLPLGDAAGFARIGTGDGTGALGAELPLAVVGEALVARGPRLEARPTVDVRFEVKVAGETSLIDFTLPVEAAVAAAIAPGGSGAERPRGAAAPFENDCRDRPAPAPEHAPALADLAPRGGDRRPARLCTLRFRGAIDALTVDPDSDTLVIGAVDAWVSIWDLPPTSLRTGLDRPSPLAVPASEYPHAESVGALAIRPGGAEVLVASESRLLLYASADGRLLRELPRRASIVRALAWTPDARSVLVAAFFDHTAQLLSAEDGREARRFPIDVEVSSVAVSDDGVRLAVGGENGGLTIFDLASGDRLGRVDVASGRAITAIAWIAATATGESRLVTGSEDGVLRLVDTRRGTVLASSPAQRPIVRVLAEPAGSWFVSGGYDGSVRLHGPGAEVLATWPPLAGTVRGLAARRGLLAIGDTSGAVSVWSLPQVVPGAPSASAKPPE